MAQVARHCLSGLLRSLRTPFTPGSPASCTRSFSSSAEIHENIDEAFKWRKITAAAYVMCGALGIYNFLGGEHHGGDEKVEYSYLHIRNKEFPWGPDGLFESPKHEH